MAGPPTHPFDNPYPTRQGPGPGLVVLGMLPVLGALAVVLFVFFIGREPSGERSAAQAHERTYPAELIDEIKAPAPDRWLLPNAAVRVGDALFVADTEDNRVLKVDLHGIVLERLDTTWDSRLQLKRPMAIASLGDRLFVASSDSAEVFVVDLAAGRVDRVIALPTTPANEQPVRPIGLAVSASGELAVSDANNSRVVLLDRDGRVKAVAGTGFRADGDQGFNVPAGLAIDGSDNIYVVDTLNGRVVKLSSEGKIIGQFGQRGGTSGNLSRPKGVAVDSAGRVFVSDGLLAAVAVFASDGSYLGAIGRREPSDPHSDLVFQAPAGLWLSGDELWVTDRYAGILRFRLSAEPAP